MGIYDTLYFKCAKCGKETSCQTKILGTCSLDIFVVGLKEKDEKIGPALIGSTFGESMNPDLKNCIFQMKSPCEFCGKKNFIKIENSKLKEVVRDRDEEILLQLEEGTVIVEEGFGGFKVVK